MALTDGLLHWWKLDENSAGVNYIDSINPGDASYNLTNGVATSDQTVAGKISQGFNGAGTVTYISTANSPIYPTQLNALSIHFWFNTSNAIWLAPLVLTKFAQNSMCIYIQKYVLSNARLQFHINAGGEQIATQGTGGAVWNDGTWKQIIATYDRAAADGNRLKLYGNNVSIATAAGANNAVAATTYDLHLNKASVLYNSTAASNINIDEVGLWNRALTEAEIASLWNSGSGWTPSTTSTLENSLNWRSRRIDTEHRYSL